MKIGQKIVTAVSILSLTMSAIYIGIFLLEEGMLGEQMEKELKAFSYEVSEPTVKGSYNLCKTAHELIQDKNSNGLRLANRLIADSGGIKLKQDEKVKWSAKNQVSKNISDLELPAMYIGNSPVETNFTFDKTTPIVDEIMEITGITCTIFQRMNEQGDMLRVATNVKKLDGTRAVGTYIPSSSPVVKTVLNGETFQGKAFVVNKNYITAYQPLKDNSGKIIGIIYVGVPQDEAKTLQSSLKQVVIGKTGYIFVVDGSDNKIIVHQSKSVENKSIIGLVESKGEKFSNDWDNMWTSIFEEVKSLPEGETKTINYDWITQKGGQEVHAEKLASVVYFEPWDWFIVSSTYAEDFNDPMKRLDATLDDMALYFIISGIILLGLSIIAILFFARTISKPIVETTNTLEILSTGQLPVISDSLRKDEIGKMSTSLKQMIQNIQNRVDSAIKISQKDLTEYVKTTGEDVLGTALKTMSRELNEFIAGISIAAEQVEIEGAQISESSDALSQSATAQAASLEEISSSVQMLRGQTKTNAENASQANSLVVDAKNSASAGKENMGSMVEAMNDINSASSEVSKVIKVIDDIAFQTNLLALNAAVEAARAGRHGKGFAVVAEEVRSLAARSAKAAHETADLIEGAVVKANHGSEVAQLTNSSLEEILDKISTATDLVVEISTASEEQANSIAEISTGLTQLDETTQQNTATAEEAASTSKELSAQAKMLKDEIAKFKFRSGSKAESQLRGKSTSKSKGVFSQQESKATPRQQLATDKILPQGNPEDIISLDGDWGKY